MLIAPLSLFGKKKSECPFNLKQCVIHGDRFDNECKECMFNLVEFFKNHNVHVVKGNPYRDGVKI